MADDLTSTEARLIATNKRLRLQLDDLTTENDGLQLRCEKLQSTVERLAIQQQQRGRDPLGDSYALVVRSDSVGHESTKPSSTPDPAAPVASNEARFRDIAEILAAHDSRMSQLENQDAGEPALDQVAVNSMVKGLVKDLKGRLTSLEARMAVSNGTTSDGGVDHAKENKKILRALDQLRTFMHRVEAREKHEQEIDMSETRERLYELWEVLGRNETDGQVRRAGPFEGTAQDFAALRDRVLCRLAGLAAYDQAFLEAKAAAHKAKGKTVAS